MRKILFVIVIIIFFFLGLVIGEERSNNKNKIKISQIQDRDAKIIEECAGDFSYNLNIISDFYDGNYEIYNISDDLLKNYDYYIYYEPYTIFEELKNIHGFADYNEYISSQAKKL